MIDVRRVLPVVALVAGAGCATWGSYLDPEPTPYDRTEASIGAEAMYIERGSGSVVLPNLTLGFRHGVAEGVDLGARVSALGLEGNMRIALLSGGLVRVSLVPVSSLGWTPISNDDEGTLRLVTGLGMTAGVRLSPAWMLLAGVRPALLVTGANIVIRGRFESVRASFLAGGQLGARVRFTEHVALVVEIGADPVYEFATSSWARPTLHAGGALRFD